MNASHVENAPGVGSVAVYSSWKSFREGHARAVFRACALKGRGQCHTMGRGKTIVFPVADQRDCVMEPGEWFTAVKGINKSKLQSEATIVVRYAFEVGISPGAGRLHLE